MRTINGVGNDFSSRTKKVCVAGLAGLLLSLGWLGGIAPAGAASTGSIGVVPAFPDPAIQLSKSWFLYEVDPGTVIKDTAKIVNLGEKEVHIQLEALDAFMTPDGSFALAGATNENQDIGTWVELETGELTIPAGQAKLVKFTLTVPQDAEVGDHIGGLAVQKLTDTPDITLKSGGTQLGIVTRAGARIYLTVKGDIQRGLRLVGRSLISRNDKIILRLRWDNRGNVRATPELVEGRIWGIFGLYDRVEHIDLGEIFPAAVRAVFGPSDYPGYLRGSQPRQPSPVHRPDDDLAIRVLHPLPSTTGRVGCSLPALVRLAVPPLAVSVQVSQVASRGLPCKKTRPSRRRGRTIRFELEAVGPAERPKAAV